MSDFSSLKECKICNRSCHNLNGLSIHLRFKHNLSVPEYIDQWVSKWPLCMCGCGEKSKWYQNRFSSYLSGHFSKTELFHNPWKTPKAPWNKRAWEESEIQQIVHLFVHSHESYDSIAKKFGCSRNPIRSILFHQLNKEVVKIAKQNNSWRRKNIVETNQKIRKAASKAAISFSTNHNTLIEKMMKEFLNELKVRDKFVFQFRAKDYDTSETYSFDFGSKHSRILIECDGDYWHGNPLVYTRLNEQQMKNKERDTKKEKFAQKNGFTLIRYWEHDIITTPDQVKQNLREALNGILP